MIDKNELIKKVERLKITSQPQTVASQIITTSRNETIKETLNIIKSLTDTDLNAMIEEAYSKGYENGSYKGTLKFLTEMTKGSDLAALKLKYNIQ